MKIDSLKANLFSQTEVGLTWESTSDFPAYFFSVERSESPEGPFETLTPFPLNGVFGFIDRFANRESFERNFYYRIVAIGPTTVYSEVVNIVDGEGSYISRYISKLERDIVLPRFNGVKSYVLIKRTSGDRCICYDKTQNKSLDERCQLCYGTGFSRPFFYPITTYVNFNPRQKGARRDEVSITDNSSVSARMSNYPILKPGDIIIEAQKQNDRYRVLDGIQTTEVSQGLVSQALPLEKLHPSNPLSRIQVPPDVLSIADVNVFRRIWP